MSEPVPSSTDAHGASSRRPAPRPDWSSGLHETLANQEASAAELRQDLDDLRRTLDAAPASQPGSPRRPFRSSPLIAGAAAVILALALVAVVAAGLAERPGRSGSPTGAAASVPTSATHTPSTITTTSSGPAASRERSAPLAPPLPNWPGRSVPVPPGLPARGVGADDSGTELTAAVAADRSVAVYERAVLAQGATALTLQPAGSSRLARSLDAPPPAVQDLRAEVNGRPVPVSRTASGWTISAPNGSTASRLTLRYRLTGALVRREPAPPGRYTLVLTPLAPSAGDGADQAVVVRISDPRIDELYCPTATNQLCGRADGALHTATVPSGASPVVVALVTFPS
jgi:hypothetical protein